MLTDEQVRTLADAKLRPILTDAGFEAVDVEPKLTDDGEPALLVTVRFKPNAPPTSGEPTSLARLALKRALESAGDFRFPHFRYDFGSEEAPSEAVAPGT